MDIKKSYLEEKVERLQDQKSDEYKKIIREYKQMRENKNTFLDCFETKVREDMSDGF